MATALVTGARGFVGGRLAKALLERRDRVVTLDRRGRPHPLEHSVYTIFHLAAETILGIVLAAPERGFDANVRGTWEVPSSGIGPIRRRGPRSSSAPSRVR